jgi:hypothetical protein
VQGPRALRRASLRATSRKAFRRERPAAGRFPSRLVDLLAKECILRRDVVD